jgi:glycosyltransferase involved in cell wall biosynthesis
VQKLSGYILTYNSEKYLAELLDQMNKVCDEVLIIDSGSSDNTEDISMSKNAKLIFNKFEDFAKQRNFALSQCTYDYVLFFDCDELPNDAFIKHIKKLKIEGFGADKYRFKSNLNILGKDIIGGIYPSKNNSFNDRLINRKKIHYTSNFLVHEEISKHDTRIDLPIGFTHYTFQSLDEFDSKLEKYTTLAAKQMYHKGKKTNHIKMHLSAIAAWYKWYVSKKSILDGKVGWLCGMYAYRYTKMKYLKLMKLYKNDIK